VHEITFYTNQMHFSELLSKRIFCERERRPKIKTTNFGGILHHNARTSKNFKILWFVICVENYHKLIQTHFLIQSPLGNLTSVLKISTSIVARAF
jgi:hypothetical protein